MDRFLDDDGTEPCCPASAARKIRKVLVGGKEVGIAQLDQIIAGVGAKGLKSEEAISAELIKQVKIFNYVPASMEMDYRESVMKEYVLRCKNGKQD